MDIQGEDSFGLSRENNLLFRHNPVHMYFNDFTVPSSKALKDLEDIDALSKHVIMKGLNEDEPNSPPPSLNTPPRHTSAIDYTTEPSLKLEEDDELGSTFAFFRKPGTHSNSLSHSVDDLLPQHSHHATNGRQHDFAFLQNPFDLRNTKPKDNPHSHANGMHGGSPVHPSSFNMSTHDATSKNSDSAIISSMPSAPGATIINHINNISNISTINNISNINNLNSYNTINTINNNINNINNINISININASDPHASGKDDLNDSMDDKSAIHLINGSSSLEFLDDYITTGSNSSSSPDGSLEHGGVDSGGLADSTASLSNALTTALTPAALSNSSTVLMSPAAAIPPPSSVSGLRSTPAPLPPPLSHAPAMHPASLLPLSHASTVSALSHSPLSHSTPIPHPSVSVGNHHVSTPLNRLHHSTSSLQPPTALQGTAGVNAGLSAPCSEINYSLVSNNLLPKEGDANGTGTSGSDNNPIISLAPGGTTVIDGVTYNNRGYEVCGSLNKFNKPCQRIGRCPFHHDSTSPKKSTPTEGTNGTSAPAIERRYLPIKKGPYKSGWKKDEHIRFLKGLQMHGKGSWKEIALIVGTRTPTQIQVHAHRYYLRQQQETKNKRSIHDISLQDLEELEAHGTATSSSLSDSSNSSPHLSPPSPDRSADLSSLFCSPSPHHHSHHNPTSPISTSSSAHSSTHLTPLSPNPLSHSDNIPHPSNSSSPPISAPSSPLVPPISSSSFPSLFSGSSAASNTLPGLPLLSFPLAPLNYHNSSWYPPPTYNMNQMSNLNSMTINMSNLGDVDLHLPSAPSFSHMSDDDYEDDLPHPHPPSTHHSVPSSPEEEFPSDDE